MLNHSPNQEVDQEVAALEKGVEMTTKTGILGGEAAVEVWIGMSVTDIVGRTGIIVDGAGAVVPVLIIPEDGVEADMMMNGGVVVDL